MAVELQRSCRSLRQLKLKGYTFYDIDIAHIAKHVKGIKALVLEFLYIYKEDVAHFLKACKELDSFILFYGEGFKMDPEILWLVSGIRDFRIFKLDCYNNMSY
ncbi:hypothetical protein AMTR_s00088p00129580 [Amborella trichopoda]|uniref:FBD domain-containing protein n=1 Tax=Amborella trichopoda TaxID=13333 RepID=W1NY09_AMBTC|nr:hypothetical protein AMTR_s00088p00129580 [Amborella trichopoda]